VSLVRIALLDCAPSIRNANHGTFPDVDSDGSMPLARSRSGHCRFSRAQVLMQRGVSLA
jgi:hypothetical protein